MTSYIIDAARTPRGRGKIDKGALSGVHPQELFAQVLNTLQQRLGFDSREVDDVLAGCVSQVGEQGANLARNAVLAAGWPYEVSAVSLNRFCASGLQAIHFGAMGVASGAMDLAIAGGVESMSRVPMGSDAGGQDGNNLHLRERVFQIPQGISADLIATLEDFSREDLDAVALRSQKHAARAIEDGRFAKSLFPVRDPFTGEVVLERDEFPRPDTTAEGLGALKPSFVNLGQTAAGQNGETFDQPRARSLPKRESHTAPSHRRQLERYRRRRRRCGARLRTVCSPEGDKAACPNSRHDHHRERTGADAQRARGGEREGAPPRGHEGARHRPVGNQRGFCRRSAADDTQAGDRSRSRQCQRRLDRARSSAWRDRRDVARNRARRTRAERQADCADYHVRRRRTGHRHYH